MNLLCPTTKPTSLRKHSSLIKPGWRTKFLKDHMQEKGKHLVKLYTKFLERPGVTLGFQTSYGTLYSVEPGTQIGMHCACMYGSFEPQ